MTFSRPLRLPFEDNLIDIAGVIFLLILVIAAPPLASDPGVGWHLMTGRWILDHQQIPHTDPFLWTTNGKTWICNQWLADLILYALYKIGSWNALVIFCYGLPLLVHLIIFRGLQSRFKFGPAVGLLASCLALSVASEQWIVRPVVFSQVAFAVLVAFQYRRIDPIKRASSKFAQPAFYFCGFALWANLHSGFALGLTFLGIKAFADLFERPRTYYSFWLLCAATLGSLVNPFGIHLLQNALFLVSNSYFMQLMEEWKSPNFQNPLYYTLLISIGLLLTVRPRDDRSAVWERMTLAAFLVLGLRSQRILPFVGILLFVPIANRFLMLMHSAFPRSAAKDKEQSSSLSKPWARICPWTSLVLITLLTLSSGSIPFLRTLSWMHFARSDFQQDSLISMLPQLSGSHHIFHTPNVGGGRHSGLLPNTRSMDRRSQ